jgi:DNA-binding transcriptional regulator YiaG
MPVEVARLLYDNGLSLRKAHDAINRLAKGAAVTVEFQTNDVDKLRSELSRLGVDVGFVQLPNVDVKRVRESLGISQWEFSARFGLPLDTLQNWEQGRNAPDAPAQLLLKLIEEYPISVESVLTNRPGMRIAQDFFSLTIHPSNFRRASHIFQRVSDLLQSGTTAQISGLSTILVSGPASPITNYVWIAGQQARNKQGKHEEKS